MKKYIIVLFFFSCGVGVFNNKDIEKEYYDNGVLKYKTQKLNNKIDGYSKFWDINGNLINEVNYSNGLLHGKWTEYYPNGEVKYLSTYQYGLKNGPEIWYYDNGIKKSEIIYKEDKIDVDIIRWDKNGNLIYK